MEDRSLKVKALDVAIKDLNQAINRDMANKIYQKWEVFHNHPQFKKAVEAKQKDLLTRKSRK